MTYFDVSPKFFARGNVVQRDGCPSQLTQGNHVRMNVIQTWGLLSGTLSNGKVTQGSLHKGRLSKIRFTPVSKI